MVTIVTANSVVAVVTVVTVVADVTFVAVVTVVTVVTVVYLALFVIVNIWTVSIHDGDYRVPRLFEPLINGSAHHTDHHLYYNYNYGQYFTLWDRIGGSFRYPSALEGKGPMDELKKMKGK